MGLSRGFHRLNPAQRLGTRKYVRIDVPTSGRHAHQPGQVATHFRAPNLAGSIWFSPWALAGSIARTATLGSAPYGMLAHWGLAALVETRWLIADRCRFELTDRIHCLADAERTAFAGRVGAAITDIVLNAHGYVWRANASEVNGAYGRRPDFVYAGGAALGHGVVFAEAHGSFAARIAESTIEARGDRKYVKQVAPTIGTRAFGEQVIHGYSIAFGSRPGSAGSFLHIAETDSPPPAATSQNPARSRTVPTSLV